ncbi:bacteriophage protein [Pandoraea eparura]|uniref:Bacteriophage protein n=1 Tax=Pandoraea eparura TaxID=2508291 RepID=A0A5E4X509_9BURK|nr:bacteriophage protein [Pandoraea eparura]
MPYTTAWTTEERETLCQHWGDAGPVKRVLCPLLPKRSADAIVRYARFLGLPKRPAYPKERFAPAWEAIRTYMEAHPNKSAEQISNALAMSMSTVAKHLRAKHRVDEIHVSDWGRVGIVGPYAPHYTYGHGRNRMKPRPITAAQACARYRDTVRKDPERLAIRNAKDRLRYAERTGNLVKRDPLVAALFGSV